jgi:hypothetical protein
MNTGAIATQKHCRLRGVILELVFGNHCRQESRLDHLIIWGTLSSMQFGVGRNEVLTALQDLRDREYIRFQEHRDDDTGRTSISKIEITPRGRDLVEKIGPKDPAILIL